MKTSETPFTLIWVPTPKTSIWGFVALGQGRGANSSNWWNLKSTCNNNKQEENWVPVNNLTYLDK